MAGGETVIERRRTAAVSASLPAHPPAHSLLFPPLFAGLPLLISQVSTNSAQRGRADKLRVSLSLSRPPPSPITPLPPSSLTAPSVPLTRVCLYLM